MKSFDMDAAGRVQSLLEDCEVWEDRMRSVFEVFLAFDENKDGYLDLSDFSSFLANCDMLDGLEPDGLTREEFVKKMFSEADADKDDLLPFHEFAFCYHKLLERRTEHNLPDVEVAPKVVSYLENHKDLTSVNEKEEVKWKLFSPPKPDRHTNAVKLLGDQSTATLVVEVFHRTVGHETGRVQSGDFLANMAEAGAVHPSTNTPPADLDVVEAIKLVLPSVTSCAAAKMLENSRCYLHHMNEEDSLRSKKSNLYDTIKEGCVVVNQTVKEEALSMFAASDHDRDRHLNLREFCTALACAELQVEVAEELFEWVDIHRRGKINAFEFVALWSHGVDKVQENGVPEPEEYSMHLLRLLDVLTIKSDLPLDTLLRHPVAGVEGMKNHRRSTDEFGALLCTNSGSSDEDVGTRRMSLDVIRRRRSGEEADLRRCAVDEMGGVGLARHSIDGVGLARRSVDRDRRRTMHGALDFQAMPNVRVHGLGPRTRASVHLDGRRHTISTVDNNLVQASSLFSRSFS